MGTTNFDYRNRCIVVTEEDLECGNRPESSERVGYEWGRPAFALCDYDDFRFFHVVIAYGYYEGACIDYRGKDITALDILYGCYADNYNGEELIRDTLEEFSGLVTEDELRAIVTEEASRSGDKWDAYDRMDERITALLARREEVEVNRVLNEIKAEYGYDEMEVSGRFSDGTAVMQILVKCA